MAKQTLHRAAFRAPKGSTMPKNKSALPECYSCALRGATTSKAGGQEGLRGLMQVPDDFTGFASLPASLGGEDMILQFLLKDGETMSVMPYRTEGIEECVGVLLATAEDQRASAALSATLAGTPPDEQPVG